MSEKGRVNVGRAAAGSVGWFVAERVAVGVVAVCLLVAGRAVIAVAVVFVCALKAAAIAAATSRLIDSSVMSLLVVPAIAPAVGCVVDVVVDAFGSVVVVVAPDTAVSAAACAAVSVLGCAVDSATTKRSAVMAAGGGVMAAGGGVMAPGGGVGVRVEYMRTPSSPIRHVWFLGP